VLLAILVFCVYGAVSAWHGIRAPLSETGYDLFVVINIFARAVITAACVMIVARTTYGGDRLVLGPMALAFLGSTTIWMVQPGPQFLFVIRVLESLMWTISLVGALIALVMYPKSADSVA
jgi:hypothetical protein